MHDGRGGAFYNFLRFKIDGSRIDIVQEDIACIHARIVDYKGSTWMGRGGFLEDGGDLSDLEKIWESIDDLIKPARMKNKFQG
jgi:hypothetical protein